MHGTLQLPTDVDVEGLLRRTLQMTRSGDTAAAGLEAGAGVHGSVIAAPTAAAKAID